MPYRVALLALALVACRGPGQETDAHVELDADRPCFGGLFRVVMNVQEHDINMCPEVSADLDANDAVRFEVPYEACDEQHLHITIPDVEADGELAELDGVINWDGRGWRGGARWMGPCTVFADLVLEPL
jgi:hypothetical protein